MAWELTDDGAATVSNPVGEAITSLFALAVHVVDLSRVRVTETADCTLRKALDAADLAGNGAATRLKAYIDGQPALPSRELLAARDAVEVRSTQPQPPAQCLDAALAGFIAASRPHPGELAPVNTPPSAPYTARLLLSPLQPGHAYRLRVCAGGPCSGATPLGGIRSDVRFTTRALHRMASVATELAWTSSPAAGARSGYAYERVAGRDGPGLFELRAQHETADSVSLSALFLFYPTAQLASTTESYRDWLLERWCVGAGTSISAGTDAKLFQQWDFRLGYELPFAPGVVLTGGISARSVQVPKGVEVGARASGTSAPALDTSTRWSAVGALGVAIDLSILGTALDAAKEKLSGK